MSKPTKQQIENAKVAAIKVVRENYNNSDQWWERALTAAAPHLQLPIEPPTDEEISRLNRTCSQSGFYGVALCNFIRERNRALISPDPKLRRIVDILNDKEHASPADKALAILALDGEE